MIWYFADGERDETHWRAASHGADKSGIAWWIETRRKLVVLYRDGKDARGGEWMLVSCQHGRMG